MCHLPLCYYFFVAVSCFWLDGNGWCLFIPPIYLWWWLGDGWWMLMVYKVWIPNGDWEKYLVYSKHITIYHLVIYTILMVYDCFTHSHFLVTGCSVASIALSESSQCSFSGRNQTQIIHNIYYIYRGTYVYTWLHVCIYIIYICIYVSTVLYYIYTCTWTICIYAWLHSMYIHDIYTYIYIYIYIYMICIYTFIDICVWIKLIRTLQSNVYN